jgi:hypothetical protein
MSGSLLQLLLRGEEDVHILSESFDAFRPFRQVVKRAASFSTQWIDIQARMPSSKVYGETLRVRIPRKGDIMRGIMVAVKVKRASGSSLLPGIQLIEEATLYSGRQVLESVSSEYMLLQHYCQEDADEQTTTERLTSFQSGETQGLVKTFYIRIPFFVNKVPIPLIAIPNQHLDLEIKFGNATLALDPTYQPRIQAVMVEYGYIDDDERRFYTRNDHTLLIERLQMQDEPLSMRKSVVSNIYTTQEDALGDYDSVVGVGEGETINLGDRILLVDNPGWLGKTEIFYNVDSPASFSLQGRFLLSPTGTVGVQWASYSDGTDYGYTMDVDVSSSIMTVTLKRDGTTFAYFTDSEVFTDVRTTVTGDSEPSTDLTTQFAAGEAWLVFNITHDLESTAGIGIDLTAEGYVSGGYFADIAPVNSASWDYTFVEGYSAVDTKDKSTTYSFYGDSSNDCILTDTTFSIQKVEIVPVANNLNTIQTRLFFRGPIRYLMWVYTRSGTEPFGIFNTSGTTNTLERHNILHSAKLLLNGQDKTGTMSNVFFNTVETARVFKKPVPAGVHCISFALNPAIAQPDGSCNFSQLQSVILVQNLKSYSDTITSDILDLDDTETLSAGQNFNRVAVFAVGWNVLRIVNGGLSLGYI